MYLLFRFSPLMYRFISFDRETFGIHRNILFSSEKCTLETYCFFTNLIALKICFLKIVGISDSVCSFKILVIGYKGSLQCFPTSIYEGRNPPWFSVFSIVELSVSCHWISYIYFLQLIIYSHRDDARYPWHLAYDFWNIMGVKLFFFCWISF